MLEAQHKNLASGAWGTLTLCEQLGNVGSEVGRAVSWHKKGNKEYFEKAFERALELLDLTISDNRWRAFAWPGRLKELVRAREFLCSVFFDSVNNLATPQEAEKYFFQFAVAARAGR